MLGMEGWTGRCAFSQESLTTGERKTANFQPCARILGCRSGVSAWPPYYSVSNGGGGDYCDRTCRKITCSFSVSMSHF